jgi:hypothetical protein
MLTDNLSIKSRPITWIHPSGWLWQFPVCQRNISRGEKMSPSTSNSALGFLFPSLKICLYLTRERLIALSLHESWAAFLFKTFQMLNDKQKNIESRTTEQNIIFFAVKRKEREPAYTRYYTLTLSTIFWNGF